MGSQRQQQTAPEGNPVMTPQPPPKSRWRSVLGRYPTGITIITSVDESGGPIGMVVGTFTSVSEDPPLVGFLPQTRSRTYAGIRRAGRFRASVLGAEHEGLCREFFAAAPEDRFTGDAWEFDEHGVPRLRSAVAWFDATVHDVLPAGDHVMVLGAVEDLGLGPRADEAPLVFLNGGYGSFAPRVTGVELAELGSRLRIAAGVGDLVQDLARELDVECALSTVVRGQVVVLTAADTQQPYVGTCFPFAAPMDPGFAAWCEPDLHRAWVEGARRLMGRVDTPLLDDTLALVREQGYAISFGHTLTEHFGGLTAEARSGPGAGDGHSALARLWERMASGYADYCRDPRPQHHARTLQVPVFGADQRVAFELMVGGFGPGSGVERFRAILAAALDHAERITELTGGKPPADYAPKLP
ncbi:flavin reductase family protein [Streptomyces sp. S465]|uniref:flavin reductase family protein n=1 Tax=Streptomyces sp. S465 TaxID=2979468 RepID=UPI0022A84127|nr:flavin reductase family protein [Streptomyces sp. S465]WAP59104.1 flavin reductase family protein [Streptomyces sp. S465]